MFQNPMQLLSLLQNNTNPMGLMNQMFGSNPIYQYKSNGINESDVWF